MQPARAAGGMVRWVTPGTETREGPEIVSALPREVEMLPEYPRSRGPRKPVTAGYWYFLESLHASGMKTVKDVRHSAEGCVRSDRRTPG